jgi:hypothetical protein
LKDKMLHSQQRQGSASTSPSGSSTGAGSSNRSHTACTQQTARPGTWQSQRRCMLAAHDACMSVHSR